MIHRLPALWLAMLIGITPAVPHADPMPTCPPMTLNDCLGHREGAVAAEHPGLFTRIGPVLTIPIANGEPVRVTDRAAQDIEGAVARYSVAQYLPEIGSLLLAITYYEGGSYVLVNLASGRKTEVYGAIAVSPDAKRLVAWNEDLIAEYSPNLLIVFRVTPDGPRREFAADWPVHQAWWPDAKTVEFDKVHLASTEKRQISRHRLTHRAGRWQSSQP